MLAVLCLQASLLVRPQYFGDEPPELRSARNILILDASSDPAGGAGSSLEDALTLARRLRARVEAGERFEAVAREHSDHPNAGRGAVFGNFAPGMLGAPLDRFLFEAQVGEVSEPLVTDDAVHLLQRIDTRAAVLQIFVAGTDEPSKRRMDELVAALRAGADFATLAREHSDDPESAARGGQFAIYERGQRDTLLKAAAFEAEVGELAGPVRTGLGYHLLERVPLEAVDAALAESHWVRLRAILVTHRPPNDPDPARGRARAEAEALLEEALLRLEAGEEFGAVAAELSDDPGAGERRGDLGWVYRYAPGLQRFLERAFLLRVGEVSAPVSTPLGFLLLRREA